MKPPEEADSDAPQRELDRAWLELELEEDDHRGQVTMSERHMTPLDHMYGGMGLALTTALMEAATRRRLRWATTPVSYTHLTLPTICSV